MKYILILSVFFLSGCGTPAKLSSSGKKVKIYNQLPSNGKYKEVGEVDCDFGFNGRSPKTNIKSCRNELRNKAASMGADIVVLHSQQLGTGGSSGGCPNCITMFGSAYKKK